ncbi:MAG: hypothetical protein HYR88_00110 [Verrucomicrobia bacterium]|nr:hypothetical protein [Verrucomicrobiota bacterium]MBI3868286.1 hypothetical protein [Verrucomicrobiota bacterium]
MKTHLRRPLELITVIVVCSFVTFTLACWVIDIAVLETKSAHQLFPRSVFDRGMIAFGLTLTCCVISWRPRRRLAIVGIAACVLWLVWLALPRL